MKVLTVYPYVPEMRFLKEFADMLEGYQKIILVPLSGSKRLKKLKKSSEVWESVVDWREASEKADTVLLLEGLYSGDKYMEIIDYAAENGKEILAEQVVWNLLDDEGKKKVRPVMQGETLEEIDSASKLHEIDTPVISVMSMGPNTNKFYVQLALKRHFESAGYRPLVLGSSELSGLFGTVPLPRALFEDISFGQKILILNQYVWSKLKKYQPDILIIGCPGGIMPYNRYVTNGFGELPLVVSKAVPIDINIVLSYYIRQDVLNEEYISSLERFCAENFETNNNFLGITDMDVQYNDEHRTVDYMLLDAKKVEESIAIAPKMFNATELESIVQVGKSIENILKTDFEVM